jgi:hypothetical protein
MKSTVAIAAVVCALAAGGAVAQITVGAPLTPPALEGFAQTGATSTSDLTGRAVLYEFFAFW